MKLSWDETKRQATLEERGLDFADIAEVFEGDRFTHEDLRFDYGEQRFITFGFLSARLIVVVWTPRVDFAHIISVRKANEREQNWFGQQVKSIG